GVLEVHDLRAELGRAAVRLVVPGLPVERDLERVLDGERAAVDEEQVRQGRVAQHAGERLDEAGHLDRVDVGVRRLVHGCGGELLAERRVVGDRRVVHAERGRGEEREQVQPLAAVPRVDERGAVRPGEVENEVEAVDQEVLAEGGEHCGGLKRCRHSGKVGNDPATIQQEWKSSCYVARGLGRRVATTSATPRVSVEPSMTSSAAVQPPEAAWTAPITDGAVAATA